MVKESKQPLSGSDKLAIALACAGGAMALILYLVEKTPMTVGVMVFFLFVLLIYPIVHFARNVKVRAFCLIAMALIVSGFGWSVWPKKVNPTEQNTPPTISQPQKPNDQTKQQMPPVQEKKPAPKKTNKSKVEPPAGSISVPGTIENAPCGNVAIGSGNTQTTNCPPPPPPPGTSTVLENKGEIDHAQIGEVVVKGAPPPNTHTTIVENAPGSKIKDLSLGKVDQEFITVNPLATPEGGAKPVSKARIDNLIDDINRWYAVRMTVDPSQMDREYWKKQMKEFHEIYGKQILDILSNLPDCRQKSMVNMQGREQGKIDVCSAPR